MGILTSIQRMFERGLAHDVFEQFREKPAGCPGSLLRVWTHGILGEQPVQLRPSCRLSGGQGARWRGWIGRWAFGGCKTPSSE